MTVCFGIEATTERDQPCTETDMIPSSNQEIPPNVTRTPLSHAASGAVLMLLRTVELQAPGAAYQAALRAIVAERLYNEYTAPSLDGSAPASRIDTSLIVANAALSGLQTEANPTIGNPRAALSPGLITAIDGLDDIATALDHQHERWDGTGVPAGIGGVDLPLAARVFAVADALVGRPKVGELPDWIATDARMQDAAGETLDPSLCQAAQRLDLTDIVPPTRPSEAIADLLNRPANRVARTAATRTAATIATSVALAGRTSDLLGLFAETALESVDAAEVLIYRSSTTQLDSAPSARVTDGESPCLDPARLNDLYEFALQAELRAGVSVVRDTCYTPKSGGGELILTDAEAREIEFIDEIIAPIMVDEFAWGSIVATRRRVDSSFGELEVAQLEQIGAEIAQAMEATSHWSEMERMALKDQLTGLGNRHDLYRVLDDIFERPPTERIDSSLIMCDVDGLKVVNDTLGHQAGDRLLIDAAEALKGAVRNREGTTVCRIGGDEFCIVIDGGALLTSYEIIDSIERLFARSAGSGPARSISCGIALADDTVANRSELLRAADENQYETKRERKRSRGETNEHGQSRLGDNAEPSHRRAIRD